MPDAHAKAYGASNSGTWMACAGSVVLSRGVPRRSSAHSREGTAAHMLAEDRLSGRELGNVYFVEDQGVEVTDEMVAHVSEYTNLVQSLRDSLGAQLLVEQRLQYGPAIGIDDPASGWGTGDAVLIAPPELIVVDLKFGRGVEVEAEGNTQLQLYALGALEKFGEFVDFERVRMIISQPRAGGVREWTITVDELRAFAEQARAAVERCETAEYAVGTPEFDSFLNPGEKQCRWCPAAATCPALRAEVAELTLGHVPATPEDFVEASDGCAFTVDAQADMEWISAAMTKASLIEHWLKAVRAEVERRLLAGEAVPGFKLVKGKAGNRAWSDEQAAEEMLRKQFRLKVEDAYDLKLISPTSAEKLLAKESPKRWQKLQPLITRPDGKPSVAPESDPRPPIEVKPVADDFADTSSAENFT